MNNLDVLYPVEPVQVDSDCLRRLYADLGERAAETMICRAMEEIAVRLARAEQGFHDRDFETMRRQVRSLVAMSRQIGMGKIGVVAEDVVACIDAVDLAGLSGTFARLVRVSERFVTAIWDGQDRLT